MDANVLVHVHDLCIAVIGEYSVIACCDVPNYIKMEEQFENLALC